MFRIWGLKKIVIFAGIYLLFGFFYWLLLYTSYVSNSSYFNNRDAVLQAVIGFSLRAFLAIPVCWLVFIKFDEWSLAKKLLLHLVAIIIYTEAVLQIFHIICDALGIKCLGGKYENWDNFISITIYIMQFSVMHGYSYFKQLQEEKIKEAEHRHLATQAHLQALKSQIQPHFLFNTLNSINATIPREMDGTRELITQLADLFRFSLNASKKDWVLIQDEIKFIQNYLSLEQRRFSDRLSIVYKIDETVAKCYIPPMLLQPLVENVIKHVVALTSDHITITVTVVAKQGNICFFVTDTGQNNTYTSKEAFLQKGTGLYNTNQRLLSQFGNGIEIEKNLPDGLTFSFCVPQKRTLNE